MTKKPTKKTVAKKPVAKAVGPKKKPGTRKLQKPRDAIEAMLEPEPDRLDPKLVRALYAAFNRTFAGKTIAALKTPDEARRFVARVRANRDLWPIRADLCREAAEIAHKPKHHEPAMEVITMLFDGPPPETGRHKGWDKQGWLCAVADVAGKARALKDLSLAVRLADLIQSSLQPIANSYAVLELARIYADANRPTDAVAVCREAIRRQFRPEQLLTDSGLASLRKRADFLAVVAQ